MCPQENMLRSPKDKTRKYSGTIGTSCSYFKDGFDFVQFNIKFGGPYYKHGIKNEISQLKQKNSAPFGLT